jgi:amino acid transporter
MNINKPEEPELERTVDVYSATMLNMGANIGAGVIFNFTLKVFLIQGVLINEVGSPAIVIFLFILGGIVSFCGTYAFTELGCMLPISGGPKMYLSAAFPKYKHYVAFIFSHVWIWIVMVILFKCSRVNVQLQRLKVQNT